jgi:hypothetical protein
LPYWKTSTSSSRRHRCTKANPSPTSCSSATCLNSQCAAPPVSYS